MPTIAELCARYHNEDVHTEQVTRLALALFDAAHEWLELARADRPLLETAARLHDIGFSVNPRRHPQVSAEIVLREGVAGLDAIQLREVATLIPLHAGPWPEPLPVARLARLGALLRVADGLDHGHLQDATIGSVTRRGRSVRVSVTSPWFPFNLKRADLKADLWRAVCPVNIRFAPGPARRGAPLLTPQLATVEAARRLLSRQFKTILINLPGTLEPVATAPLHDLRVAVRRLRALLRVFNKRLPKRLAKPLLRQWGQLSRGLGPARDRDVWLDFLKTRRVRAALGDSPLAKRFVQYHRDRRRLEQVTVQRHLRGPRFNGLQQRTARLLRVELPHLANANSPAPAPAALAQRKFQQAVAKIRKRSRWRQSRSAARLHKLRGTMRRARYLGEFFGELLGRQVEQQTKRIKRAEQTLGRIHDLDVSLERLRLEGPTPPRALVRLLQQEREARLAELDQHWTRMRL